MYKIKPIGFILYIPLFHQKSDWEPESCDGADVEEALEQFKAKVTTARARYMKSRPSNLRPTQFKTIERLQDNDDVIVIEADKNLGAEKRIYEKRGGRTFRKQRCLQEARRCHRRKNEECYRSGDKY